MTWNLAEAKNRLSEVVNRALSEGPQTITRRNDKVVVISAARFEELTGKKLDFKEYLLQGIGLDELDLTRDAGPGRDPNGNPAVKAALDEIPTPDVFLSVLTVGEIVKGIALLAPGPKKKHLAAWLAGIENLYGERTLPLDVETARIWGELTARSQKSGVVIPPTDGLLAATALRHGLHVREDEMSESQANPDRPDPAPPVAPRREVADWEYTTSYIPAFQVRLPERLHAPLIPWAEQERKTLSALVVEILEQAVSTRGATPDAGPPAEKA
ncbi:hypothetical protein HK102_011412 [Quaeritorhiza haematococci]|nr:hypothetical protein HK102_011412 [Quaeritorhiza haematococci]